MEAYKGYLALVLHAHLPYVRHPEYTDSFEEDWLYEAITETYIPLLNVFESLVRDGIDFRLTLSLSPPLMEMLADPFLQDRYIQHLEKLIELADKEVARTQGQKEFNKLALMYQMRFRKSRQRFVEGCGRNLIRAFGAYQDMGKIEITTCAATHGFLPLMEINREAVRAQIRIGARIYEKHLGRRPRGIWLPECGYNPGDDEFLRDEKIRFFFVDTHAILYASPKPRYAVYAPVYCPSGVAAFGRDLESSKQVWSAKEGYPGDYDYREFYRDVGYDLDMDYIRPYIHESGQRINTGIKYYRITGPGNHKEPYVPEWALEKAASHAGNFLFNREKQVDYLYDVLGREPIIVAPYDAELFGHWWYEGPAWINMLSRKIHCDQKKIRMITPSEYLDMFPQNQVATPSLSSWGYKGYAEVWLNGSNDWIYRHLHKAASRMTELADRFQSAEGLKRLALNQAARELLLAQSSDWAFIMKTGTMTEYARKRTRDHILRFNRLYENLMGDSVDEGWLRDIEGKDNYYREIDYRDYATAR
jgi:1,4-alpha-glucan branching enzyme